ncbi:MAG: alanine racemase [Candidatus Kryptonium sp.]|nr:alanine racemase [Candidatus Kryptonium sp.]MCX7762120.1 alanine racemase [Candidatus Kryptonium sp.]MDW8108277.1 alanine racemase [Candidatus Kryptonium sp.]
MRATRAEIDLSAFEFNFKQVRKLVGGGIKIMAVVKANAYGHGAIEISKLAISLGADYLAVAIPEEGIELRENGIDIPILVFTPAFEYQMELFFKYDLTATITSLESAQKFNVLSDKFGKKAKCHIKVDTGMGRIGIDYKNAYEFVKKIYYDFKNLYIEGIYTHFATSDERDKSFAYLQFERFISIIREINMSGIDIPLKHCANSGAILDMPETYLDMVRPGIMLYGYHPSLEVKNRIELKPVMTLKSKVAFVKEVEPGTSISYGRRFIAKEKTKIATIPIGYADGFRRSLTNLGKVEINGVIFPVVGTVTMDQIMVDVGLSTDIKVGDDVILFGNGNITAWDVASLLGTIPYEICCGISSRVPRIYVRN